MNYFDVLFAKKLAYNPPLPPVIKRVTGNPIELTDAASAPMVKCVTAITGSQDLHGYDKPWVGGAGKNIMNPTPATAVVGGITMEVQDDGGIRVHGTSGESASRFLLNTNISMSAGNYTMSMRSSNSNIRFISNGDNGFVYTSLYGDFSKTFNITEQPTVQYIYIDVAANVTIDTSFYLQLEKGSSVTTFEPYSNICPITAYTEGEIEVRGHNIYDGEAIAGYIYNGTTYSSTTHKMSKNYIPVKPNTSYKAVGVNGDGQVTCYSKSKVYLSSIVGMGGEARIFTTPSDCYFIKFYNPNAYMDGNVGINYPSTFTEYEPYVGTTHTTTYPSAIYRGSEDVVNGEVTAEWGYIASYNGETLPGEWISDRDEYAPNTTPTTGAEVAYELATPTTSSVTPTNLPIRTLSGYNHIESSTGDMIIDYITDAYQNFVDTVESALPNTRKGGAKALDIFLSLEPQEKPEIKKEEDTKTNIQEEK